MKITVHNRKSNFTAVYDNAYGITTGRAADLYSEADIRGNGFRPDDVFAVVLLKDGNRATWDAVGIEILFDDD